MLEESQVAMYVSFGSLLISVFGFIFSIRQASNARKMERIKVYDKVYHDVSDLLVFHYKKEIGARFVCDDKKFEKAVNDYGDVHWLEQYYGFNIDFPEGVVSESDKAAYRNSVADAYRKYSEAKQASIFNEFLNYQSPVFHLDDDGFKYRFDRLMLHVTENLSFFSGSVLTCWESIRFRSPEQVKNDYISLSRINQNACEPIDEPIDDPYLKMLLLIRHEYRDFNRGFGDKVSDFKYRVWRAWYKLKVALFKERSFRFLSW